MEFTESEICTIKRALIIYDKSLPRGLRGRGFFIDSVTFKTDIQNIMILKRKLGIFK